MTGLLGCLEGPCATAIGHGSDVLVLGEGKSACFLSRCAGATGVPPSARERLTRALSALIRGAAHSPVAKGVGHLRAPFREPWPVQADP